MTPERTKLAIEWMPISTLRPNPNNPRTHSKKQIRKIANCIRKFGFLVPVLVNEANQILAGHGRVEGAEHNGMTEVPVIRIDWLSPEQFRALLIADNRVAEEAGWDNERLAIELQALLIAEDLELIDMTGFEVAEIDMILEEAKGSALPEEEPPCPLLDQEPVTQPGDLWILGEHRISCDNSLHSSAYQNLLGSRRAAMVFSDLPYNVPIHGHATGNGSIRHREFAMASGEMTEAEYRAFLITVLAAMASFSTDSSLHYVCEDWRHIGELLTAGQQTYDELVNLCVWVKDNGGLGSFYRSQHELVAVFRKGRGSHRNNIQLGQFGRNRTNVWSYPGVRTQSMQGDEGNLLALHPTVKPIAMVADAILDCTARGEVVLDSFLGSGTTLMAAERVGRICCGIEIDPLYVDVAIRRWQKLTGEAAIHAVSKRRFDDIAAEQEVGRG